MLPLDVNKGRSAWWLKLPHLPQGWPLVQKPVSLAEKAEPTLRYNVCSGTPAGVRLGLGLHPKVPRCLASATRLVPPTPCCVSVTARFREPLCLSPRLRVSQEDPTSDSISGQGPWEGPQQLRASDIVFTGANEFTPQEKIPADGSTARAVRSCSHFVRGSRTGPRENVLGVTLSSSCSSAPLVTFSVAPARGNGVVPVEIGCLNLPGGLFHFFLWFVAFVGPRCFSRTCIFVLCFRSLGSACYTPTSCTQGKPVSSKQCSPFCEDTKKNVVGGKLFLSAI